MNSFCYNACTETDSCQYDWGYDDMMFMHTCEEFYTMLEEMSGNDETCELQCEEPHNCAEQNDGQHCEQRHCTKECEGYTHDSCTVTIMREGELHDIACEEFNHDEEDCEWQCETYYDCAEDMDMQHCEVSTCYQPCDMEGACFVNFVGADGEQRMDCDEFMILFDVDMEDDECNICEKTDCANEEFGFEHCEINNCFDHCSFEEKCYVKFKATEEDEIHKMSCDTFEAILSGECVDVEEKGSCKEDLRPHFDDVHACNYTVTFNTCEEDNEQCSVHIVIGEEVYDFADCDEADAYFELPECEEKLEEGDCMEDVEDMIPGVT